MAQNKETEIMISQKKIVPIAIQKDQDIKIWKGRHRNNMKGEEKNFLYNMVRIYMVAWNRATDLMNMPEAGIRQILTNYVMEMRMNISTDT
jgi:hypothetical protein